MEMVKGVFVSLLPLVGFIAPAVFVFYLCKGVEKLRRRESYIKECRVCAVSFTLPFAAFIVILFGLIDIRGVTILNGGGEIGFFLLWACFFAPAGFVYQLFQLIDRMVQRVDYARARSLAALFLLIPFGAILFFLSAIHGTL